MTVEEIRGMESLLTCRYPDPDTGACPSTCGTSEIVGYGIFTIFLCCSNFILLNLVMAVLMQELQVLFFSLHYPVIYDPLLYMRIGLRCR
jgi:hypothetical protein